VAALEAAHHVDDMGLFDGEVTLAALIDAGWSLSHDSERRSAVIGSERSDNEALVAALEGLWEAANRYRQDVAKANEYLNQDLPSARSLVFALGKARSAIEGRP